MLAEITIALFAVMISVCCNALLKPHPHDRFNHQVDPVARMPAGMPGCAD